MVGVVTTGGTESCLLAVKTARDLWRRQNPDAVVAPRLIAPVTVHAAFQKAAHYFGLHLDLVPVAADGTVAAAAIIDHLGDDVALVVVSAPSYPFAALDPVEEVAVACAARGISLHVDACIGGLVLPFWRSADGADLPLWDFRVSGVTSVSADLHKFGYSPKGVSVLLQRGRERQRAQFFATTRWPGYPVVNPTILGSKSAGPLAASWAIIRALGTSGFAELAASCARSTRALVDAIGAIEGLRIVGDPVGPLLAVATDESVRGGPSGRPAPLGGRRSRPGLGAAAAARPDAGEWRGAAADDTPDDHPGHRGDSFRAASGARGGRGCRSRGAARRCERTAGRAPSGWRRSGRSTRTPRGRCCRGSGSEPVVGCPPSRLR